MQAIVDVIRLKRAPAATWVSLNPVLQPGEPGLETDTRKMKFGDGTTAWNSLPYSVAENPHNHDGVYSLSGHDHAGVYSPVAHNHDGTYAPAAHNHDGTYAPAAHNHDGAYVPLLSTETLSYSANITLTYVPNRIYKVTASGTPAAWTLSGAQTVSQWTIELTNGGSQTQTWFSGVTWDGGLAPTLTAAGVDILTFYTINGGTTIRGFLAAKDIK